MKFLQNIKMGFTLAEVLLTLVIIGVIASMTIPTLMNNTNKQEYVSRLKKTYSALSQATNRIIAEEGNPRADIGGWATSIDSVFNMYKKYLSNAKECGTGQNCFDTIDYKNFNTSTANNRVMNATGAGQLVLADGAFISFRNIAPNCDANRGTEPGDDNVCCNIYIDVNGQKGPNMWGKDAFRLYLKESGVYPSGCDYDSSNCIAASNSGTLCTCAVLREGAINY